MRLFFALTFLLIALVSGLVSIALLLFNTGVIGN